MSIIRHLIIQHTNVRWRQQNEVVQAILISQRAQPSNMGFRRSQRKGSDASRKESGGKYPEKTIYVPVAVCIGLVASRLSHCHVHGNSLDMANVPS